MTNPYISTRFIYKKVRQKKHKRNDNKMYKKRLRDKRLNWCEDDGIIL